MSQPVDVALSTDEPYQSRCPGYVFRDALAECRAHGGTLRVCRAPGHCTDPRPAACEICFVVLPEETRNWTRLYQAYLHGDA